MKDRSIIFKKEMINAIYKGHKSQTRRIVKEPKFGSGLHELKTFEIDTAVFSKKDPVDQLDSALRICPYGRPGDRLWVKETFANCNFGEGFEYVYRANYNILEYDIVWTPSIFMPKVASRLLLKVNKVRCERLNDISEEDAIAEGINKYVFVEDAGIASPAYENYGSGYRYLSNPIDSYKSLWESINGAGSWDKNPWVWVIEFEVINPVI